MFSNIRITKIILASTIFCSLSINAEWFKADQHERYKRIAWHTTKVISGAILAFYSVYKLDKRFTHGLVNGIGNVFGDTISPQQYPTISALVAAGVCIASGVRGLQKEIK